MLFRVVLILLLFPAVIFPYTVVRKDGKVFQGNLIVQNPSETIIKGEDGIVIKFRADQIDWQKTTVEIQQQKSQEMAEPQSVTFQIHSASGRTKWTGEPISFDFKDIDIRDFFRFIAELTGLNMIIDPQVKGAITMKMTNVPWDQVLDLVCRTHGLGYQIEGNVISLDK